jgi:predicted short-subunit dehydrogenase-like oxidoreductase (DUF2520 family)
MKKLLRVGLVVEGNATKSPVLRLSSLIEELGPIKSVSLQVARRISNSLRAGYAVTKYEELAGAPLILLKVPDSEALRVVAELVAAPLPFREMAFVVCETWLTTDVLIPLRRAGAQIASLVSVGPLSQQGFVLEGDLAAVRKTKRLLQRGGARSVELRSGAKPLYFAANLLTSAITTPALQLAQRALRESGVSGTDLTMLMNEWWEHLGASVRKGGRAKWGGPLTECSDAVANENFRQLTLQNPALALALEEWLHLARRQVSGRAKGQSA